MNTLSFLSFSKDISAGKSAGTPPLYFLPSWLFFSENIAVDVAADTEAVRGLVALQIESFAPIPPEQLLSGFRTGAQESSVFCYAAARERLRERLANVPAGTLHVVPVFALWENTGVPATRREWIATDEELTAITVEQGSVFPKKVMSWQVNRAGDSDSIFYAKLNALRLEKQQEFSDGIEEKPGIFMLGSQVLDKKRLTGTIEILRLTADGGLVPAARTLSFSLADNSLWLADIRDSGTLARERKERKSLAIAGTILRGLGIFAGVLVAAQIVLWIFNFSVSRQQAIATAQAPAVREIQNQANLIDQISKVQENKLQLMRVVAVLNAHRPQGVGFTNFSGNGTTGMLSISGNAETIALANEFEKNIRACRIFKNIVFSANIASTGTNFSMQCAPVKPMLEAIDFYDTGLEELGEENVPAASGEGA